MKKIIALLIAVMMLFTFGTTAFAATITVNNAVSGQTYSAYKIFDVVKAADATNTNGYAYTIAADSAWFADVMDYSTEEGSGITLTENFADSYDVTVTESVFDAAAFAEYLNTKKAGKTADATKPATGNNDEDTTVILDLATAGYYFVDSSLGAICILNTAADSIIINEKNEKPTIFKAHDMPTASIGDTVTYTITVDVGKKADTTYIVHDKMEAGLTLNPDSFIVKLNDTDVDAANYEIITATTDGDTFDIIFKDTFTSTFADNDVITIEYTAILNKDAEIADETNDNTVHLQYGNSHTVESTVQTKTFEFDIIKTDDKNTIISGAEFKIFTDVELVNAISFVKNDNVYRVAEDGEENTVDTITNIGRAQIEGLGNGTYYLVETKAPAGFNALTAPVEVVIDNANNTTSTAVEATRYSVGSGGIQVINNEGSILPGTGGIGTTIFYVVGGVLVLAAVVLLVVRKRMSVED